MTDQHKRWLKRRQTIEPMIGHAKSDNRMDRCWLQDLAVQGLRTAKLQTRGSEVQKTRPVIIVSNDVANRASNLVTVVPMTSNTTHVFPFEVALDANETSLRKDDKAMAQQVRTIDKAWLGSLRQGMVSFEKMTALDAALRLHLAL